MKDIDIKFRSLRVNLRKHGSKISEDIYRRYHPSTMNVGAEICVFCMSTSSITREHVIPKWLFQKDVTSTFISSVNKQTQSYNKSVIPTCANCNNFILSGIEKHIIKIISEVERANYHYDEELYNIIRWLELIDYKTQVYDCRRKYIKYGNTGYSYNWGALPISMMRHFPGLNPFKGLEYLRRSQKRITKKSKNNKINSLVVFSTSTPHFYFFTQPDKYVYVSFPMYKVAVFYFLQTEFDNYNDASEEALYYIKEIVNSK